MLMNRFFGLFVIVFLSLKADAQNNGISFLYGFTKNDLYRSELLDGGPGYDGKSGDLIGISYMRNFNRFLALETGVEYSKNSVKIIPEYFPETHLYISSSAEERIEDIKMFTVPVYVRFTFLRFLYINAGALIDFEISREKYQATDDQSGIGFGGGIGTQFTFKHMTIFISPVFRYHAVIPFQKESYHQHLIETSLLFGLGYNF